MCAVILLFLTNFIQKFLFSFPFAVSFADLIAVAFCFFSFFPVIIPFFESFFDFSCIICDDGA